MIRTSITNMQYINEICMVHGSIYLNHKLSCDENIKSKFQIIREFRILFNEMIEYRQIIRDIHKKKEDTEKGEVSIKVTKK